MISTCPENFMLRRCFIAVIGLLASVSLAPAQTSPDQSPAASESESPTPQVTMEDPQMGNHWTYEVRDQITGDPKPTIVNTVTDV
jgi:hypothetical protein